MLDDFKVDDKISLMCTFSFPFIPCFDGIYRMYR